MRTADDLVPGLVQRTADALAAMQAGRYAEAAPTLELAAITAHRIDDIIDSNLFGSGAVEAYAKAGDMHSAVRVLTQIVDLYRASGKSTEIARFGRFTLKPLRRDGFAAEADAISAELARLTGGAWHDPDAPKLPAFCSNCGAAVKPAEIVRPTPTTVACHYCGASLDR
jgi:hypothetical protein